jgi:hypothetical protein
MITAPPAADALDALLTGTVPPYELREYGDGEHDRWGRPPRRGTSTGSRAGDAISVLPGAESQLGGRMMLLSGSGGGGVGSNRALCPSI